MLRLAITSGLYTDLSNAANSSSAFSLLACSCALSAFVSRLAWVSLSARLWGDVKIAPPVWLIRQNVS